MLAAAHNEGYGKRQESQKRKGCVSVMFSIFQSTLCITSSNACALLPLMPKDTLDDKTVLEILWMADEDMLRKGSNPVYLSLKAEYDRLR